MKKIAIVLVALVWIFLFGVLIVAITNIIPDNVFREYRFIVGIGFIAATGLLGIFYRKLT